MFGHVFYKKSKGFTIVELLVAMLLGSLAISFAAWAFLVVSKSFQQSKHDYAFHTELLQFRNVMENDMENATTIAFEENVFTLKMPDSTLIYYDLFDNKLVRSLNQHADTFNIMFSNINHEFYSNNPQRVNSLSFDVIRKDTTWGKLRFFKKYPETFDFETK